MESEDVLTNYIREINRIYRTGRATEHTYRPALQQMLSALMPGLTVLNEPQRLECGAPDFIIADRSGLAVSFVEAKDIGDSDLDGNRRTGNKEQFERYKAALGVIAFTDYLDFHLYLNRTSAMSVRIGEVRGRRIVPVPGKFGEFLSLVEALATVRPAHITSATQLARLMAGKARMLQHVASEFLARSGDSRVRAGEEPRTDVGKLFSDFRRALVPDMEAGDFADVYAQTITYGMFAARLNDRTPETFSRMEAASLIPRSNPFLRQLFNNLSGNMDSEIEWVVDDIAALFAAVDVERIMGEYGKATGQGDPMVHFYEDFLAQYDAGVRKDRGVWYTPLPVVRFIVRVVDELLRTRFSLLDGLADASKTEIEVEEFASHGRRLTRNVRRSVHKVQVLDPATGTGTFLAECIRQVRERFAGNDGAWPGYARDDLMPRLNGFEILMASYTMAHIKLDMTLAATGCQSRGGDRFKVFLTNSLVEENRTLGEMFMLALGDEAHGADAVKRDTPVMVVIGNPPYSGESQNKGDWITRLMEDYKKEPGGRIRLQERNPKWLNDDYVKFLRLAEHYVEKNGSGIVAYINPHGFLDNPTFRGMRWRLMQTFDEMYFLNLHGNSKKKEVAPDGGKDECVFNIMQGVSINFFVKKPNGARVESQGCRVFYADLWGKRADKFAALEAAALNSIEWQELAPTAPMFFFVPRDTAGEEEYNRGFRIDELFEKNSVGVVTGRDDALVGISIQEVKHNVVTAYGEDANEDFIQPFLHCVFDRRYVYYDHNKVARSRKSLMKHFCRNQNIALIAKRGFPNDVAIPIFVADSISNFRYWSNAGMQGGDYVFPLWLYEENMGTTERSVNLKQEIVDKIAEAIGGAVEPQELFDYIYAVLHTPEYRVKYREFLKTDFPRIPYPKNGETLRRFAVIGAELRETHLMKDAMPPLSERTATFPVAGDNIVECVRYEDAAGGHVWINGTQYFNNIAKEDFEFFIGGYQPAQKWLKDRKGRTLANEDIKHYQRIVLALRKTRQLMAELSSVAREWM